MTVRNRVPAVLAAFCPVSLWISPAAAHAFGQRYDLPAPLWLYLTAAGASVALSFVVTALVLRRRLAPAHLPRHGVPLFGVGGSSVYRHLRPIGQGLFVVVFALVLATGIFGLQNPQKNFAPTMVWVIGWVGMAYVAVLIGDVWSAINPWKTLYSWVAPKEQIYRPYPTGLGAWPAVILFAAFAWLELVSEAGDSPRQLALLIAMYSIVTWFGMTTYGSEAWLKNAEAFSVFFTLFARFAPIARANAGRWILRPPAVGLLTERPESVSRTAFVILILSTVSFDGFLETPAWLGIVDWLSVGSGDGAATVLGVNRLKLLKTGALIAFTGLLATAYLLTCRLIAACGGGARFGDMAGGFVLSLVPIAIAYHIAHYFYYLLISGQAIIPLISDPFGWGWNLLGTAGYRTDIAIIDAKFVWYLSVATIVLGHLISVFLAHVTALRYFGTERAAAASQVPMVVLMVGYTMISLWILSQPVVSSG